MLGLLSDISAVLLHVVTCHMLSCHVHRLQALLDFLCIGEGMLAVAIILFPEGAGALMRAQEWLWRRSGVIVT